MINLAVTYVFRDGAETQAQGFLRELVSASRAESGCRRYDVYRAMEAARTYLIFEQYDDEPALEAHRSSDHFMRAGKNGIQMIAESRSAALYTDFS